MRGWNKVLASSVFFGSTSQAFSSSGQTGNNAGSLSVFGSQGSLGGPTEIKFATGICLQGNFGNAAPSSGPGVTGVVFNLLGSNTLNKATMSVIKTATIASTGPTLLIDEKPFYRYVDFQIVPSTAAITPSFATVVINVQGNQ